MAAGMASALGRPSSAPELISVPSPAVAVPVHGGVLFAGVQHRAHGQAERLGEVEVALVVCRDGHDGARAVVGQDVVGGPDGQLFAVERVDGVAAGEDTGLFALGGLAFDLRQRLDLFAVGVQGRGVLLGDQFQGQRGVGGDDEERGAVQGVRARGEDGDVLGGLVAVGLDDEVDVGALGAADPVLLHGQHALGPVAAELLHVVQQPVGVLGDLEVPLVQRLLGHRGAAALAGAVNDLLVGQHGLVLGAPVDRVVLAVGQAAFVEALEQPLGPAVVLRIGGVQPAGPVSGDGVALEGRSLGVDVGVGPLARGGRCA